MRPTEPIWKSYICETTEPIFSPKQCQMVIDKGMSLKKEEAKVGMGKLEGGLDIKKRITSISWIPFKDMPEMYKDIESTMLKANNNHFGFEGMQLTEPAQFTHYLEGGFYDWHMDNDVQGKHQQPVRKISMTLLLSDPATFEGGELEIMSKGKTAKLKQGQAIFFASWLQHRVKPVTKGERKSLVMWFGGPPFK
jgi:PKHD-type hydroxylase|tara:strand:+ start:1324 stop:1905 length:582 start_codon:yes stop_codon:yes gene_type:complete